MSVIADLRSDTLTRPTEAMRRAMAAAEVGDDVFGEDPSVNRLQRRMAETFGKEAALFVPSGTMANLLAIKCHTKPGDEVLLGVSSHPFNFESGGAGAFAGVQLHPVPDDDGCFTASDVTARIRPADHHYAPTRLVMVENTQNRRGGLVVDLARIEAIRDVVRGHGLRFHLDGARLMNAVVATGIEAHRWAEPFDSVCLCFSKGLGAPIGSILVGTSDFIDQAHRYRKMLGGGMRQAGVLAAAALHALDHHVERLAEDHARAQRLAGVLRELPRVRFGRAPTNILLFEVLEPLPAAATVVGQLAQEGLKAAAVGPRQIRMVTHLDFDDAQVAVAVAALRKVLG